MAFWGARVLTGVLIFYALVVLAWFLLQLFLAEPWWWLYMLNTFALYLFVPLPLLWLAAFWLRGPLLWAAAVAVTAVFLLLYGGLFLPSPTASVDAERPTLRLMTYNLLYKNEAVDAVVTAIAKSDADVVAVQELNTAVAEALRRQLHEQYPYRVLHAATDHSGLGLLSRYPLRPYDAHLPQDLPWIGDPLTYTVLFDGQEVLVIGFHVISPGGRALNKIMRHAQQRDRQAAALAQAAAAYPGPVVMMGDLNAVQWNQPYNILTQPLNDSWRAAGWGFGLTFPGGPDRPHLGPLEAPPWLIRIDYIFYSDDLQAVDAHLGPWDGHSDHRPTVAEVQLKRP